VVTVQLWWKGVMLRRQAEVELLCRSWALTRAGCVEARQARQAEHDALKKEARNGGQRFRKGGDGARELAEAWEELQALPPAFDRRDPCARGAGERVRRLCAARFLKAAQRRYRGAMLEYQEQRAVYDAKMKEMETAILARAALGASKLTTLPLAPAFPTWRLLPARDEMVALIRAGDKEAVKETKRLKGLGGAKQTPDAD
jgi:hypothetical protein